MENLQETEAIKQLKYRYFRALDTNDWQLFADCLDESCTAEYGDGKHSFDNRNAIVDFMSENMSSSSFLSMHHGHHPEISIAADGSTATGIWYLQDMIVNLEHNVRIYGTGIYSDRYVKSGDSWKISHTGYARVFECLEPLGSGHRVLRNMFAK
ncbi:MAG: nuclear transport factor 2 family protein [Gammaproteobacteria bacterium]|nr:nuclear transport factor 2 family protein [Gammaproteobacteria bacterium]MDH3371852.1 nuclear transport factor 2 family protein [Gammaproteobacteria bacterium]MDH3407819.1 nuclear transport factor 2 family protein [Gammaproteobacteria bacterium]MDH3551585.1 nuclear transport factor 2 family protein [Gammaproteobacteria bacterium]